MTQTAGSAPGGTGRARPKGWSAGCISVRVAPTLKNAPFAVPSVNTGASGGGTSRSRPASGSPSGLPTAPSSTPCGSFDDAAGRPARPSPETPAPAAAPAAPRPRGRRPPVLARSRWRRRSRSRRRAPRPRRSSPGPDRRRRRAWRPRPTRPGRPRRARSGRPRPGQCWSPTSTPDAPTSRVSPPNASAPPKPGEVDARMSPPVSLATRSHRSAPAGSRRKT